MVQRGANEEDPYRIELQPQYPTVQQGLVQGSERIEISVIGTCFLFVWNLYIFHICSKSLILRIIKTYEAFSKSHNYSNVLLIIWLYNK